ncbi:MAG: type II toxin-antitoxin system HicA family toxin [bacterium]|nr:type II toxin-antitoxin system HicA family toxin [bacterium]
MTSRHRRTLAQIFETPTRKDRRFSSVETLMASLGGMKRERAGSRVAFVLGGRVLVLHRPHHPKLMRPGAIEDLRDFLIARGITPGRV